MDLNRLKYFISVVQEGSISKAARSLNMTQPPLSMQIKKLENDLGVKLFERLGKRLCLTDLGELLYKHAKELMNSHTQMLLELNEQKDGLRGTVFIGSSTAANIIVIPDVIAKLKETVPAVVVKVSEGSSKYVLNKLRNRELDVGFVREISNLEDLDTHNVLTEPLLLALPPNHKLLKQDEVRLIDLKEESFLLPSTTFGYGISDQIIESCNKEGFSPNITYWGTQMLPMLLMVNKAIGITFVPEYFRALHWDRLPPMVKIHGSDLTTNLKMVTVKGGYKTAITKKLVETTFEVIEELKKQFN